MKCFPAVLDSDFFSLEHGTTNIDVIIGISNLLYFFWRVLSFRTPLFGVRSVRNLAPTEHGLAQLLSFSVVISSCLWVVAIVLSFP